MKRLVLLAFVLLLNVLNAKSETINGADKACPNSAFNYGLSGHDLSKTYRWKITKGKRSSDNATEFCDYSPNIRWDADLGQNGKIEVYLVSACNQSGTGTLVASMDVKAFDFVAGSPMPTTNGTCANTPAYPALTCGTSQDIDVWFMLPLNGDNDYNNTSTYDFTANSNHVSLPTGWSILSGSLVTSDYTCEVLAGQKYKRIMVTVRTDGVHSGDVKVRVSGNCSTAPTPYYGAWSSVKNFSFAAPSLSISGPTTFCTTGTYTIPNLPAGATVSWSVSALGTIVGTNTATSVEISSTATGNIVLTGTVVTGCGSYTVTKTIFVGLPWISSITFKNGGRDYLCASSRGNYFTISLTDGQSANGFNYDIELLDANTLTVVASFISGYTATLSPYYDPSIPYIFRARIRNHPCGTAEWYGQAFEYMDCSSGGGASKAYVIYPNPSSTELKIKYQAANETYDNSKSSDSNKGPFIVKLLNEKGNVLKERNGKASDTEIVLPVADIPNGIYYLHIYEGKNVSKQQVVIKH